MIELRDRGQFWALSGLATTYGQGYFVAGRRGEDTFREIIHAGAFENATHAGSHIELRVQHDQRGPVLASTTGRTLTFEEGAKGLLTGGALRKSDPNAQDAFRRYQAGELRSFSVGMQVLDDHWPQANERHVTLAYLREVSLVDKPCNPGAVVTDLRYEVRSGDPIIEYRMVPLTGRQDAIGESLDSDPDHDEVMCIHCGGSGKMWDGAVCPVCDGSGLVDADQDADDGGRGQGQEGRRDFTDREKASLGAQGKAVWLDGHWAFPTPTRSDYDNAVHALGRTPGKDRATVRRYLMKRARAEGWPIPGTWKADGTTESREALIERLALDRIQAQREEEFFLADLRAR